MPWSPWHRFFRFPFEPRTPGFHRGFLALEVGPLSPRPRDPLDPLIHGKSLRWIKLIQMMYGQHYTHRIHGAAIYGNIYHQYTPNVSIYTSIMDPMGYNYNRWISMDLFMVQKFIYRWITIDNELENLTFIVDGKWHKS